MEEKILDKIKNIISSLKEEELENYIPDIIKYYNSKINYLAFKAYGNSTTSLAKRSFFEQAKIQILKSLKDYIFKFEHWKNGKNLDAYLRSSLNNLSISTFYSQTNVRYTVVLICPACKVLGQKSFLYKEDNLYRCNYCTSEAERLQDEFKKSKKVISSELKDRQRMCKKFSLHSKKGVRCSSCHRFIPENLAGEFGVACPYIGCDFFGKIECLEKYSHPTGQINREISIIDAPTDFSSENNKSNKLIIASQNILTENVLADSKIEITQLFSKELSIIFEVIDSQIELVKRMNSLETLWQKVLMYKAYKSMCVKYPEEMVSYLAHLKLPSDSPIQSRIFQEFLFLVEDELPFTIQKHGEDKEIFSISDPDLGIFIGKSIFNATIDSNHIIKNCTIETYVGSRQNKNFGPCFLGKIIDIVDKDNKSIKDNIKKYTFVQIEVDESIPINTEVTVSHFRIHSHYELNSLVYLQKVRRNIVDKVYFKLNGKKRIVG